MSTQVVPCVLIQELSPMNDHQRMDRPFTNSVEIE